MTCPQIYSTGVISFFSSLNLDDYGSIFGGGLSSLIILAEKNIDFEAY